MVYFAGFVSVPSSVTSVTLFNMGWNEFRLATLLIYPKSRCQAIRGGEMLSEVGEMSPSARA